MRCQLCNAAVPCTTYRTDTDYIYTDYIYTDEVSADTTYRTDIMCLVDRSQSTMGQALRKMGKREIYQNNHLAPHFWRSVLIQMKNICRTYLISFTFNIYLGKNKLIV